MASNFIQTTKQNIYTQFVTAVNAVTGPLTTSKYLEGGVLTPDEFVEAGNLLTFKCSTWSWESGIASKAVGYLPKDKQFLLTRNVPCYTRAHSLEEDSKTQVSQTIKDDDGDDWVAPAASSTSNTEALDITPDIAKLNVNTTSTTSAPTTTVPTTTSTADDDDDDDSNIPDMNEFEGDNLVKDMVEDDKATFVPPAATEDNILKTRTYDLSITYDQYHQTPRVWLSGYDENRNPLKPEQIFEDISEDHARKTVTIEAHPFLGTQCAYIHPCRHAEVMKKLIQRQVEAGKKPRVDQYLFLFLKFIAAVIPTIEYDFTLEMDT